MGIFDHLVDLNGQAWKKLEEVRKMTREKTVEDIAAQDSYVQESGPDMPPVTEGRSAEDSIDVVDEEPVEQHTIDSVTPESWGSVLADEDTALSNTVGADEHSKRSLTLEDFFDGNGRSNLSTILDGENDDPEPDDKDAPEYEPSEPVWTQEEEDEDYLREAEETRSNAIVSQVSLDDLGYSEVDPEADNGDERDEGDKRQPVRNNSGPTKKHFKPVKEHNSIPRLKKNMILFGLIGILGGGLLFFNVITSRTAKKKTEAVQVEPQPAIDVGSQFSLGDMPEQQMTLEEMEAQWAEDYQAFAAGARSELPSYEMTEEERRKLEAGQEYSGDRSQNQVHTGGQGGGGVPAASEHDERELAAIASSIRKDSGYGEQENTAGITAVSPVIASALDPNTPAYWAAKMGQPMSREQYIQQQMAAYEPLLTQANTGATGGGGAVTGGPGGYGGLAQSYGNNSEAAIARANNGRFSDAGAYNPNNEDMGQWTILGENTLFPGTIIHAVLVSRIDTDYPGPIHARVSENVYDSKTGKNLLIPQGTILQGNYSSSAIGVAKVQIAWESMVVNFDGMAYQVSLGGMAGVDKRGRSGISGFLDDHYFEWLKAAGVITLFTMLNSEIAYQTQGQSNEQLREIMDTNAGIVQQLGDRLMNRALNITPSVKVPNGKAVSVSVNAPITLRPFRAFKAEQKWVRKY